MKAIRVFEAFAGYGSQAMALKKLQTQYNARIQFEFVGISEIDENAIKAYHAVHGPTHNYGDISTINWGGVPDFDLLTYSFPCTDISLAGKMKGLEEGSGTRSSLLWECRKAIVAKRPKYLLMENVKTLQSPRYRPQIKKWEAFLKSLGYTSYSIVMNAKHYANIPQNRERFFMVSILNNESFCFPGPVALTRRVEDFLEPEVAETYHMKRAPKIFEPSGIQVINPDRDGCCRTIKAQYCFNGVANLLGEGSFGATGVARNGELYKLSTRECFRLMGVSEHDIDILENLDMAKTYRYKLAGNSIVVDVLYRIFEQMFIKK